MNEHTARVKKLKWSIAEDISYYKERLNLYLSMIELPEYVLQRDDV